MIEMLKNIPADKIPPTAIYSELVKLTGLRNDWTAGEWLEHMQETTKLEYIHRIKNQSKRIGQITNVFTGGIVKNLSDSEVDKLAEYADKLEEIHRNLLEMI
jgi:hypothetical protein